MAHHWRIIGAGFSKPLFILCGNRPQLFGKTYSATEWQEAKTAYAYAIAYCAFSQYFATAKQELKDAIEEFADDAARELEFEDEIKIQINNRSQHGWAAHDRELADGTMIFESRQLDGCNGMERDINGIWVSCCFEPVAENTGE